MTEEEKQPTEKQTTLFVVVRNKGTMPIEAAELVGAGQRTPLGEYGMGINHAVAVSLRMGIQLRIHSGNWKLRPEISDCGWDRILYIVKQKDKNTRPRVIRTGFTTRLGAHWTDEWFLLRAFLQNAMVQDEFSYEMKEIGNIDRQPFFPGETVVFLEATPNIVEIIRNIRCFVRLDAQGHIPTERDYPPRLVTNGPILFRRGIKIADLQDCGDQCDYELPDIQLTEDGFVKQTPDINSFFPSPPPCDVSVIATVGGVTGIALPEGFGEEGKKVHVHKLPDRVLLFADLMPDKIQRLTIPLGYTDEIHRHGVVVIVRVMDDKCPSGLMVESDVLKPGSYQGVVEEQA